MGSKFEQLKEHILALSEAKDFDTAKAEWDIDGFRVQEDWDQCPCGQDIKELCYIKNTINEERTYVGNVCINQFMEIETGNLFDGIKRLQNDITKNPNKDLIEHAYKCGYLYGEKEYKFLMGICKKRKLSEKQESWKLKINRRILKQIVVRRKK